MTPDERKNLIRDYQKTFLSAEGQNVLADLSRQCNENAPTFVPGSPDRSAFLEGGRAVMLYIRRLVRANPEEEKSTQATTEKEPDNG